MVSSLAEAREYQKEIMEWKKINPKPCPYSIEIMRETRYYAIVNGVTCALHNDWSTRILDDKIWQETKE